MYSIWGWLRSYILVCQVMLTIHLLGAKGEQHVLAATAASSSSKQAGS